MEWYFGIGLLISGFLGILLYLIFQGIEIDKTTDFILGVSIICVFIGWPIIIVMIGYETLKLAVWRIKKTLSFGR